MSRRVVLLGGDGDSTRIVYHYLAPRFDELVAVVEDRVSRLELARRRAKKMGWVTVCGQMAFVGLAMPVLKWSARDRIAHLLREFDLDVSEIPGVTSVDSVNSPATLELIRSLDPDVVVVNGTRIIAKSVLSGLDCVFVNTHSGITPRYRGVHGGYWALREGRADLAGTTVHLIDAGIDTGGILAQACFETSPQDSIATYAYLHLACGLPLLAACVEKLLSGDQLEPVASLDESAASVLRSHPTLWDYLSARATRHVR